MSSREHTSPYQPAELPENRKRPTSALSTQLTCCVCDEVFFDKLSFKVHFSYHLHDTKNPWCFQSARHLSNSSPYPSTTLNNMNKRSKPLSVSSADVDLVDVPILNSMPPMNPPLKHERSTSPSRYPLLFPRSGEYAPKWPIPAPLLNLRWGNGYLRLGDGEPDRPSAYKNLDMKQLGKPAPEIVVISDDEDENKGDEIDLTLKL